MRAWIRNDLRREAVESVQRRGFYDFLPPVTLGTFDEAPTILAQFLRLVEEVGEFMASRMSSEESQHDELADVAIVWCQLANLTGYPVKMEFRAQTYPQTQHLIMQLGQLARALRKLTDTDCEAGQFGSIHPALAEMERTIMTLAPGNFDDIVRAKLAADEKRGVLHGDVLPRQANGAGA